MLTSRCFGDRATLAVEVSDRGSSVLREVDLWVAGTLLTEVDNSAYVPLFSRVLRETAAQVRRGAVRSQPYAGESPEATFRRFEDDESAFPEEFWFLRWGETVHNVTSYGYLEDGALVLVFAFRDDCDPRPENRGRVFHARLDPAEFAAVAEAAADLLAAEFRPVADHA